MLTIPSSETSANQAPRKKQDKRAAQQLLREWLEDESGYDEATWPELKRALNDNRGDARRSLFRD